jgi:hypothetical protein
MMTKNAPTLSSPSETLSSEKVLQKTKREKLLTVFYSQQFANWLLILICLSAFIYLALPTEALARAKRIIDGKEAEMFDAWIKSKDGTEYGFGVNSKEELRWLFRIIIAQVVVCIGM